MKKTSWLFLILALAATSTQSQTQLKIYHGAGGETHVYDKSNNELFNPKLHLKEGETIKVKVLNANPVFYKYALKYEHLKIESEDKQITDLLNSFGAIISSRVGAAAFTVRLNESNEYRNAVNILTKDINEAKGYILQSDKPELPKQALDYSRDAGFRLALDKVAALSKEKYHFHNSNLLSDLNSLASKAAVDDLEKEAFSLLNNALIERVNAIKAQANLQSTKGVWEQDFTVSDSMQKIIIVISQNDKTNKSLIRDGNGDKNFEMAVATVIPDFKRSVLELVPVATWIYSSQVREFFLENSIVGTRSKADITVKAGAILNINVARFGQTKEMSFGLGPGYKFSATGDAFENFYLSALFSYKNFLRIGLGLGFAQFPATDLKHNAMVGKPLPNNVSNLNDIIKYEEKPSGFLIISFTGLSLTKKK